MGRESAAEVWCDELEPAVHAGEVHAEVVKALAERERHSLVANIIGWFICVAAAASLPNWQAFVLPLALRPLAMTATRLSALRLRHKLAHQRPFALEFNLVAASMAFAGVTWGALLWPVARMVHFEPPALAIIAVTTVAVSLISVMCGSLPRILLSFALAFVATAVLGFVSAPEPPTPWAIGSMVGSLTGIVAFSLGSARQTASMAEMLVENRRLGEELADALAHAEFLSKRDPLTGLLNRRAFRELLDELDGDPITGQLLAIDLDHFKRINDRFGHALGDRVLAATGDSIRDVLHDIAGGPHLAVRRGGEEFAILLCGVGPDTARGVAEALRHRLSWIGRDLAREGLTVSASIGIAGFSSDLGFEKCHAEADALLYRAKDAGRDRVLAQAA